MIGRLEITYADEGDTVFDIARRHDLGVSEVLVANPGLDTWMPNPDRAIVLPGAHIVPEAPREGIVINLGDLRLYLYEGRDVALTVPIGIGREGFGTPLGTTTIVDKIERPAWYPTAQMRLENPRLPRVVPPGPHNPLGNYALRLDWRSYFIHGTNKPDGIGQAVSHGCIRLYPEDIARLFARVAIGTRVTVVDQPVKLGWDGAALYLEAHPVRHDSGPDGAAPDIHRRIATRSLQFGVTPDWRIVDLVLERRDGIPARITTPDGEAELPLGS